jgi:anti-anti-sigma factor
VSPEAFRLERTTGEHHDVIAVHGDLDIYTSIYLHRAALGERDVRRPLVLDLDATAFIDSSGIGALVACRREAARVDATVRLVCAAGPVRRLLTRLGLDAVIGIDPTLDAAEAALGVA